MDHLDRSYEPMDIDLSAQSENTMDISFSQAIVTEKISEIKQEVCDSGDLLGTVQHVNKSLIKKYHINVPKNHTIKPKLLKIITSCILIVFLATVFQRFFSEKCMDSFDLLTVRKDLISKLYGQNLAIDLITTSLEFKESKILLLYGSTGVGKTYAVSLIFNSMWESANIYHFTAESFIHSFSPHLLIGMTFCKTSTFIIDNLNYDDLNFIQTVNNLLVKSKDLKKIITVILIYNCDSINDNFMKTCENNFLERLKDRYKEIKTKKVYIQFKPLQEEHLKKCIQNELGNKQLTDNDYANIAQNFNVTSDGCKGVYSKMKFLNLL